MGKTKLLYQHIKKLLVSVLMGFLLLLLNRQCIALSQSRLVTLKVENVTLKEISDAITTQTGLRLQLVSKLKDEYESRRYSTNFYKEDVLNVIKFLFYQKNLICKIGSQSIYVGLKEYSEIPSDSIPLSNSVNGIVRDVSGNAVPGATIFAKRSNKGTTADAEGRFTLSGISKGENILISSIGFQTKEVIADHKQIIAELNPFINRLNETQIIAYGTTTRRNNTGNVTTIKASELKDLPVTNPILAIQGRVPGLDIRPSNGLPGAGISLRIQGQNSLKNGNDPLIIVDGVPYPSQSVPAGPSYSQAISPILGQNGSVNNSQLGSPLSYLNTSDIESIDVLKGADATSIYGSRAANGVILITTKKGKAGKVSVTVNIQSGIKKVGRKLDLMSASEYLQMRREALKNDGDPNPSSFDYDLNGVWDTTVIHDWQKELLGGTGSNTLAEVSVQGGNENTRSILGASYYNETYIFPQYYSKRNDRRGAVHIGLTSTTPNKRFQSVFIGNILYDENNLPITDFVSQALLLSPVAPKLFNSDGTINWQKDSNGFETFQNPIAAGIGTYRLKTTSVTANLNLSYEILKDLKLTSSFGFSRIDNDGTGTKPLSSLSPATIAFGFTNSLQLQQGISTNWNIEPTLTYKKQLNSHSFEGLIGSTITNSKLFGKNILAAGFNNDLVIEDISSASRLSVISSSNTIYRYNALFGRLTYNYGGKYIVNLTGRRDGSSRFGPENRFHSFGSIGAAWIFTEEPFISQAIPFLSFGKIRSSYGTSGNDQIGDYRYLTLYSSTPSSRPYQGVVGLAASGITNPYLQWENIKKFEIGLETGFFDNRFSLNLNYALNKSSNQLVSMPLPSTTGFSQVFVNLPATIQNRSWEINVTGIIFQNPSFSWTANATLTVPKNKLVSFPNIDNTPYANSYIIGKSINTIKVYNSAGINDTTGVYQFYDSKGNVTSNPNLIDRTILINADPKFYGGFFNTLNYRSITLNIGISFDKRYIALPFPPDEPGAFNLNVPQYFLDRWKTIGDKNTAYQRYTALSSNYYQYSVYARSNKGYLNTYYVRCNNINLNWELPTRWKNALNLQMCSIYLQLMNPFVITNFKQGLDPATINSLPPLKTYNIGVKATL